MKFSHFVQPRLSFAAPVTGGNATGVAVDTLGFEQAQACLGVDQLPLDGVIDWKVQGSDDGVTNWADLTGAAGDTITVTDDTIVAVANVAANGDLTIAAQPPSPSRLRIEIIDTTPSISDGAVHVTGLVVGRDAHVGAGIQDADDNRVVTEVIATVAAGVFKTTNVFSRVDKISTVGFAGLGGSGDETIEVGIDNSNGIHTGRIDCTQAPRFLRIVTENVAGGSGDNVGFLNLYSAKRQPVQGEFGEASFGFQV